MAMILFFHIGLFNKRIPSYEYFHCTFSDPYWVQITFLTAEGLLTNMDSHHQIGIDFLK